MALVVDGGGLVKKGGALGTGAACCCRVPCNCSSVLPAGCEVDYIAVVIEFRFNNCGNGLATQEFILNAGNGFSQWVDPVADENGNLFQVNTTLECYQGKYHINWQLYAKGQDCLYVCDFGQDFIFGFNRRFPITTQIYNGACCPVAIDSYEYDGENALPCAGSYVAFTDITIVLL